MAKENKMDTEEPLEKQFWKAIDKLGKNIDAAEDMHIVKADYIEFKAQLYENRNSISAYRQPYLKLN